MDRSPSYAGTRTAPLIGGAVVVAYALIAVLLSACASGWQAPPPGGPPDSTAPAVETSSPASGTVNFSDRTVTITFSEYIDETKAPASVVITPIPARTPEFDFSGRTMEITFAEPLLPNRTYAVTLGSAVTDISGNRLGRPFTLRFSTGDHIDSGRIGGTVSGRAQGKAYIFAWQLPEDTARFNATFRPDSVRPDFIAPIGDDGTYTLEGLPTGRFRLMAVVDEYGDQLYTPGQDAFGVAPTDVVIGSQITPAQSPRLRLREAPLDLSPPALYTARSLGTTFTELKTSEPLDTSALLPRNVRLNVAGTDVPVTQVRRGHASRLLITLEHPALSPGAEARVTLTDQRDSVGNRMPDSTATATFTVAAAPDTVPPALLPLAVDSVKAYTFGDSIVIAFDRPVRATNLDDAVVMRDSGTARARFRLQQISPSEFIARPLESLTGVQRGRLEIAVGRFTGTGGGRRDSLYRLPVAIALPRQSGALQGTLTDTAAPNAAHIIILRAATGNGVYRTTVKSGAWEFTAVPEGEYEISAFRDTNGDGAYSFGTVSPYTPAEPWTTWNGTVRVRPRWTTDGVNLVIE